MENQLIDELKSLSSDLETKFDGIEKSNNELSDRLTNLEQKGTKHPDAQFKPTTKGYRKFYSEQGPVYEIDATTKAVDVLEGKRPEISFERWLGATVAGEKCEDKDALAYIRETKSVATTSTGVNVPTEYMAGWIDNLRAESVLQRAGAITVPMSTKTVQYSRLTADPAASWHQEAGAVSATDPTFESASLTAKTIVCRTQVTMENMQDSPNFGGQLGQAMFGSMAAAVDLAGLHGSGSNGEPAGIYGQSGVLTVAGVGTPTNYVEMIAGLKALLDANVPLEAISDYAIMSPRTWATYQNLVTGIASDNTPLERPQALRGMEFMTTTNVNDALDSPADNSAIFMGDFSSLVMGIRMNPSFKVLELDTYASNLLYEVVATARVDFMLTHPARLCTLLAVDD